MLYLCIHQIYQVCVSPNLSVSLVIQCFKCGNEIKIHYEIIFDLLQLPHSQVLCTWYIPTCTHITLYCTHTHYLRHFPYLRRYSCMHNWLKYTVHRLLADRLSLRCFLRFCIRCFHRHLLRWSLKMAAYHFNLTLLEPLFSKSTDICVSGCSLV